jgi:hypothetical protein
LQNVWSNRVTQGNMNLGLRRDALQCNLDELILDLGTNKLNEFGWS